MSSQRVTVFGGTGFLGSRIVRRLRDTDFVVRIASRHPDRGRSLFSRDGSGVESVRADVNEDGSVASAVAGAWAVVNAVSLYVESGKCTFHSVHVEAAKRIGKLARQAGVETLVHISGIGADAGSASPYISSRGEGEAAVLDAYPSADLVRPAVMFGPGDAFLTPLLAMLRRMPVFPMFGSGATRLQPAYVEDVAEAIVRILRAPAARQFYELAGPRVYTYQELLRTIAARAGITPFLVPFPFSVWHIIGHIAEALPTPPLTRNQVELMGRDNITEPDAPGFEALQISPQAIEDILPQMLQLARKEAQV
jgi:NADH dehydrogenase